MRPTVKAKLTKLVERYEELKVALSDPDVTSDMNRYRELSKEFSQLEPFVESFKKFNDLLQQKEEANVMLREDDSSMQELAKQEIKDIDLAVESLEESLLHALIPKDPNDDKNIFLEVRAGTGGDEAAIFAGDLVRMYLRHAEDKGFKTELISESYGEHGGYKEAIMRITGDGAYSRFKFESGVHRVQRVPETEAQGRVHTSTCTVAVMPEAEAVEAVDVNPADLRIDTFRASGAGGQHVQKTDSAIRITHVPTGVVVECQDERSQHKNKAKAMALLSSKLLNARREKQHKEQADTRRSLVGTGERSERIRTYNYPQGRLTDHRINLTLYQLTSILEGALDPVIDALEQEHNADLIASLDEDSE